MSRPWQSWIIFGLSLAVVLGAMGWVSLTALRLDRAEAEAMRQAALEENVRLALWRMDSALAPLMARENARPYFSYCPFYAAERAYTRMFAEIKPGEVLVPSPLLTEVSPYVLLHFQFGPHGELTSPQVPASNMRDVAEASYTTQERILAAASHLTKLQAKVSRDVLLSALIPEQPEPTAPMLLTNVAQDARLRQRPAGQIALNTMEQQARAQAFQRTNERNVDPKLFPSSARVRENAVKAVWVDSTLVLARRVSVNGEEYVQGCWLDWTALRRRLIEDVKDLLPTTKLEPMRSGASDEGLRMLATLPVKLVPGPVPAASSGVMSPIRLSLFIAWGCVLVAAVAVGVLLSGALSLSERRGAFVSAVTHELRTPLTTFRMYAEMLAEKMVTDEKKRERYLDTLRLEAERLSHLVENVLAYARLEKGRVGANLETFTLQELLGGVRRRLAERAEQAGMSLIVKKGEGRFSSSVKADPSVVEQILFNLVDNACKYAVAATDKRIHLEAGLEDKFALLAVRDHGPGISKTETRRLFRPFSKSAKDAANSAPGVGLGLALSRRLARQMGGNLRLEESVGDGACFVLTLPLS